MSWQNEIPLIIRSLINDLDDNPTYSDSRIQQLSVVAALYVVGDINLSTVYTIDIEGVDISPDPCDSETRDIVFIGFVALKAACLLDQSTFRTKAALEGIRTSLGSASLAVGGHLAGYKTLIEVGPCSSYASLSLEHNIGNATAVKAILSPFVGNNFDPSLLLRGTFRGQDSTNFYS